MTNTPNTPINLVSYINEEIDKELKASITLNEDKLPRQETILEIYEMALHFLEDCKPNEDTEWEHKEYSLFVQALKDINTISSLELIQIKMILLQNRVIYKDDKVS